MSDTFNDGDPIDATLIQKLKTDVAKATALAGSKVAAGSNIDIRSSLTEIPPADIVTPKFFGGKTDKFTVNPGRVSTFEIDYREANFSGKPTAIILTPISKDGFADIKAPSIISGTVSEYDAQGQIYGSGDAKVIRIFFIAVQS